MRFDKVDYNGSNMLTIQGVAASDQDILKFIENLGKQKLIDQASLSSMKLPRSVKGGATMKGFRIFVKIKNKEPTGIIFSGGPASVHKSHTPKIDQKIFSLNIPILGICYGMQLIVHQLGGRVEISKEREFGKTLITHTHKSKLFQNIKLKNNRGQARKIDFKEQIIEFD